MSRIKRGIQHAKRRRNLLRKVKGYKWGRKSKIKLARTAMFKAGKYAYRDRRVKKRNFRRLWSLKINAALREQGTTYSKFIGVLKKANVELDRKILADFAENHPELFKVIVTQVMKK